MIRTRENGGRGAGRTMLLALAACLLAALYPAQAEAAESELVYMDGGSLHYETYANEGEQRVAQSGTNLYAGGDNRYIGATSDEPGWKCSL